LVDASVVWNLSIPINGHFANILYLPIIDEAAAHSANRVQIGATVTVDTNDGKVVEYTIVGPAEASPTQGKLSNESPYCLVHLSLKTD
jgi:transcription elongation GreA/GreB family factor